MLRFRYNEPKQCPRNRHMNIDDSEKLSALKEKMKELFASQLLCVLSTDSRGQPYSNLVAFTETDNLRSLIFATKRNTIKYSNALSNTNVAVLIDGRTNKNSDFKDAMAITAIGTVEEATGIEYNALAQIFLSKHPYLDNFVRSPSSALMRVKVKVLIAASFNETNVINLDTYI